IQKSVVCKGKVFRLVVFFCCGHTLGVDVLQDFFFCVSIEERNTDMEPAAIATQIIVLEISELESRTVNRASRKTKPAVMPIVSAYFPKRERFLVSMNLFSS
ncbi:MAG: hypothetical protein ACK5NM_01965, partial [Cyclobacteriaceae bacterium]